MAVSGRRVYWNKRQFDGCPRYKRARTRELVKRKPYMWRVADEEFGELFAYDKYGDEYTISFNSRHKAYCGWDIDRQRFVIEPHRRITLMMRGTWKFQLWYG